MRPPVFYIYLFFSLMLLTPSHAGQVTLSTYYPAPTGSYQRLKGIGFQLVPTDLTTLENMYQCALPGDALSSFSTPPGPYSTVCPSGLMYYDKTSQSIYVAQSNTTTSPPTGQWNLLSGNGPTGLDVGGYQMNGTYVQDGISPVYYTSNSVTLDGDVPASWTTNEGTITETSGAKYIAPNSTNSDAMINKQWVAMSSSGGTPTYTTYAPSNFVDNLYPLSPGDTGPDRVALTSAHVAAGSNNALLVNLDNLPKGTLTLTYSYNIDIDQYIYEYVDVVKKGDTVTGEGTTTKPQFYNPFYFAKDMAGGSYIPTEAIQYNQESLPLGGVTVYLQKWTYTTNCNLCNCGANTYCYYWQTMDHTEVLQDVNDPYNSSMSFSLSAPYQLTNMWNGAPDNFTNYPNSRTFSWQIGSQPKKENDVEFRVFAIKTGVKGYTSILQDFFTFFAGDLVDGPVYLSYVIPVAIRVNALSFSIQYQT